MGPVTECGILRQNDVRRLRLRPHKSGGGQLCGLGLPADAYRWYVGWWLRAQGGGTGDGAKGWD